jgi:formylglycine-generating enzyme required for sulfatase activity
LAATRLAERREGNLATLQAISDKANSAGTAISAEIQSQETETIATPFMTQPASTPTAPSVQSPADVSVLQPGATMTNSIDGAVYAWIPPGEFTMGSADEDELADDDEKPVHTVEVDGFWIMQSEVTNAQYGRCVEAGACTPPANDRWNDAMYAEHPVTGVDWRQASAYAAWAGGRLPTDAEWEKACRGTDGRIYPWGDEPPNIERLNSYPSTISDTIPVRSYPPGANGLYDMAGNVWEWTADWYDETYYAQSPTANPQGPESGEWRTLRGGSWNYYDNYVRCAVRFRVEPGFRDGNAGF